MNSRLKRRLLAILLAFTFACSLPLMARADDEDAPVIDARLQGYANGGNMALKDASGSGLTWLLLVVLGGICVGVMFMNSKRTHLD